MPLNSPTTASERSCGSKSAESHHRHLETLFGIRREDFLCKYAGRSMAVAHGPLARLRPLLKDIEIHDVASVQRMALEHSSPLRINFIDDDGMQSCRAVRGAMRRQITARTGNWYVFDQIDRHFDGARDAAHELCRSFGYPVSGATCQGFFHTPEARVARHCDDLDAVVVQLFGTRKWRLEPNSDPPIGVWDAVPAAVGDREWDDDFAADSPVIELAPGSALYVPGAWWHETRSSDFSFSLTYGLPGPVYDSRPDRPMG